MVNSKQIESNRSPVAGPVLAVIMVIIVEAMFFGGLISAFVLAAAGQVEWPPASQPRLPVSITFTNMLVLLFSAWTMWQYLKSVKKREPSNYLQITIILGLIFYLVQGYEWFRILLFGVQTSHSLFASFFYTLIGLHGFHVLIGLLLLIILWRYQKKGGKNLYNYSLAVGLFWFFVVALWPILYNLIYLN